MKKKQNVRRVKKPINIETYGKKQQIDLPRWFGWIIEFFLEEVDKNGKPIPKEKKESKPILPKWTWIMIFIMAIAFLSFLVISTLGSAKVDYGEKFIPPTPTPVHKVVGESEMDYNSRQSNVSTTFGPLQALDFLDGTLPLIVIVVGIAIIISAFNLVVRGGPRNRGL